MKKLLLLMSALIGLILHANAQIKKVFYIDEDRREIRVMNPDGSGDAVFFKQTETLAPRYLAVNGTTGELFFSSNSPGRIYKIGVNGLNEQVIYSGSLSIYDIEIDEVNAKIYWTESETLKRANLDGSGVETLLGPAVNNFFRSVAISGNSLYWTQRVWDGGTTNTYHIIKGALDGTGGVIVHTEVVPNLGTPVNMGTTYGLDIDATNGHMYWASNSADGIFRKNSDGSGAVTTILNSTHVQSPRSLSLDVVNNKLYWADTHSSFDNFRSANLDGSGVTVLNGSLSDPYGSSIVIITPVAGTPEIDIQGNATSIVNGDATPSTDDGTDFGQVALNNNYVESYFFIRNLGGADLTLGNPTVTISGAHASDFTLQSTTTSPVGGASNTSFLVRFDPSVIGVRTATVTVNSNDTDESVYSFTVQGTGAVSSGEIGTNDIRLTTHATGVSIDNENPDIAYDPTLNRYLLVYETEIVNSDEEIFGQFVDATGGLIGSPFQISKTGVDGNTASDAADPRVVFNTNSNKYFVVWEADPDGSEKEIYGQFISPNGTLEGGFETGVFRVTTYGPNGDPAYSIDAIGLSANTTNGSFYVSWNTSNPTNISQIHGVTVQSNGTLGTDTQLSAASGTLDAYAPEVTYNSTSNQYLVVYHADIPNDKDNNIWARIVNADGTAGTSVQVTAAGVDRDAQYANTIYNPVLNEYLVIYNSDHVGPTDNESETYGQRVSIAGALVGTAFQISFAGVDGDGESSYAYNGIAYNSTAQQILVTFSAVEPGSVASDIFCSTLDASNYALLETQSRVSDMGNTNGDGTYFGSRPRQVYNPTAKNFIIVWEGTDEAPNGAQGEDEIYAQLWQSPPIAEIDITGNDISIVDGDNTPSTGDNTDFGSLSVGANKVHTFKVLNLNNEQLVLDGTPTINITGAHASDFTVSTAPATAIAAGGNTTFEITFTPSGVGARTANISISNNDAGENPYDFTLQGTGLDPIVANLTLVDKAGCNGSAIGSVKVDVTSGTAPYTYTWSNGAQTVNTTATTNTISNLVAASYHVTITDGAGKTLQTPSIVVENRAGTADTTVIYSQGCDNVSGRTETGVYYQTLQAANTCDSVIESRVVVNKLTATPFTIKENTVCTGTGTTIFSVASQPGITYELTNSSNQLLAPTEIGTGDSVKFETINLTEATTAEVKGASKNFGGLELDGVDDYLEVPVGAAGIQDNFTVEAWARPDKTTGSMGIFSSRAFGDFKFDMKFLNGNLVHGDIGNGSDWITTSADAPLNYEAGRWYHIAYVVTTTGYEIYIDSELVTSVSFPANSPRLFGGNTTIEIGHVFGLEKFDGGLDNIRVWNTARTASEIKSNYRSILSGKEDGLVLLYDFGTSFTDGTIKDKSNSGFDGTLRNVADFNAARNNGFDSHSCILAGPLATNLQVAVEEPDTSIVYGRACIDTYYTRSNAELTSTGVHYETVSSAAVCDSVFEYRVIIEKLQGVSYTVPEDTICTGSSAEVHLQSTVPGVSYQLTHNLDGLKEEKLGTGNALILNTGVLTSDQAFNLLEIGDFRGEAKLDGVDDYISVNTGSDELRNNFTIEMWAKPARTTGNMSLISSRGPADASFDLKFQNGNLLHGDIGNGSGWINTAADAPLSYEADRWYHIAYAVSTTGYEIYVDTVLVGSGTFTANSPILFGPSSDLKFGRYQASSEQYEGSLDNIRIWNTTRTAQEIKANYRAILIGQESGLVLYYDFKDDFADGQTNDLSSNGYTGVLQGMNASSRGEGFSATSCGVNYGSFVIRTQDVTDKTVTVNGDVLTANDVNVDYSWLDCEDNNSELGETGGAFTALTSGSYAVKLTNTVCNTVDTSACEMVVVTGLSNSEKIGFSIYPNPAIEGALYFSKELTNVMILDPKGRVFSRLEKGNFISTESLSGGVYYLKSDEGITSFIVE